MKIDHFLRQFNWRFLLLRILVNAIALAATAAVVPKIYFVDKSIWSWLLMAALLGILNAFLKPVLQILTLQFIFVTFGLVVVLVNALILGLLSFVFPSRFAVDSFLWALVGGLVLGVLSSFLESLLGLTMPIVDYEPPELRQQIQEQARHVDWVASESTDAEPEELALATEPVVSDETSSEGEGGQGAEELGEPPGPDTSAEEPSAPGPDEGTSLVAEAAAEAEPPESAAMPSGEKANSEEPEPAPEPREESTEDLS